MEVIKNKLGRPSSYSQEIADELCERIAKGQSVRTICKDAHMPDAGTVYNWLLDKEKKDFFKQYARARNAQAENLFDELLEIADDGTNDFMTITKGDVTYNVEDKEVTNRSRLRVDTRKWYLSKVLPKKYGDKLDLTSDGDKLPTPLLNVLHNDSDKKSSGTEEEN